MNTDWCTDAPSVCCGATTGNTGTGTGTSHIFMSTQFAFPIFPKQLPVMYRCPGDPTNGTETIYGQHRLVSPAPLVSSWAFAGAAAVADGTGGAAVTAPAGAVAATAAAKGGSAGAGAGASGLLLLLLRGAQQELATTASACKTASKFKTLQRLSQQ